MKKPTMIALAVAFTIIAALSFYSATSRADTLPVEPTVKQKLAAAEAVVALVTGPVILPIAVVTGQRKELCDAIRMRPRSCFDDNSEGRDQCPCGNWLRVIPLIRDHIQEK